MKVWDHIGHKQHAEESEFPLIIIDNNMTFNLLNAEDGSIMKTINSENNNNSKLWWPRIIILIAFDSFAHDCRL